MRLVLTAAALSVGIAGTAGANVIFDQLGDLSGLTLGYASQIFEEANAGFNIAALDDFSVSGGFGQITSVEVAMVGFGGFSSIDNVTGWSVEIYSSVAAAGTSLTGDVGSAFLTSATIAGLGGLNFHITLDLSGAGISLANGDYWIAVTPHMAFGGGGGQLGVLGSPLNDGPGLDPNGYQANPNGGFSGGWGGPTQLINPATNLGYRITAVPAPGALALLGLAGLVGRRRR